MSDDKPIDPGHKPVRRVLRIVGPILLAIGILFIIVALVDFFSVMASHSMGRHPTKFWGFFVGMPLMFIGVVMTQWGYMGRIARYFSQEITPVGTDTFNYAARHARDGVRDLAGAIGDGLRGATGTGQVRIRCHKCNHENDADAKFCSACGSAISKSIDCPDCRELNDPDARFCDNCGRAL